MKELVTGVLWNLSSCDDLKRTIIDECLLVLVSGVIVPHSGWDRGGGPGADTHWTTVFRNSSGILRYDVRAVQLRMRSVGLIDQSSCIKSLYSRQNGEVFKSLKDQL